MAPARITISTVGIVSKMRTLAADMPGVNLALSLHAATQERRLELVPSSSSYTVEKIVRAMDDYIERSGKAVMIEFILIEVRRACGARLHDCPVGARSGVQRTLRIDFGTAA